MPRVTPPPLNRAILEGIRDDKSPAEVRRGIQRNPSIRHLLVSERQIQRLMSKFRKDFGNRWKFIPDDPNSAQVLKLFVPAMFEISGQRRAWITDLEAKWFSAIARVMEHTSPRNIAMLAVEYAFAEIEGRDTRALDLALAFGVWEDKVDLEQRNENVDKYVSALAQENLSLPNPLTWPELQILGTDFKTSNTDD